MEKDNTISRRTFFKRTTAAGLLGALAATGLNKPVQAAGLSNGKLGTLIDLSKCDGCKNYGTPLCVEACGKHNQERFPEPQKPLKNTGHKINLKTGLISEISKAV